MFLGDPNKGALERGATTRSEALKLRLEATGSGEVGGTLSKTVGSRKAFPSGSALSVLEACFLLQAGHSGLGFLGFLWHSVILI